MQQENKQPSRASRAAKPEYAATAQARWATRLAFFAAGFAMACCAPLFPFFKENVGADKAEFGLVLLCLGLGSIIAMPVSGILAARRGARPVILVGGFGLVAFLPVLAVAQTPMMLGAGLFFFGASLGTIDVAMNVHGAEVEGMEKRPLMSNFHAQFSIGGFCGAGLVTLLLSASVQALHAACIGAVITLLSVLATWTRLLAVSGAEPAPYALPKGVVLLLSMLAGISFLVEGAVLDWGALLIIDRDLTSPQNAGIGYILLSIAMVVARLSGDYIVATVGEFPVLIVGGIVTIAGIATVLMSSGTLLALSGFILIGLGVANLVPILFSAAGRQKVMPPGLAIASVTTTGYAGILLGPAMIGFVADASSLITAFWWLALLIAAVPVTARFVVRA